MATHNQQFEDPEQALQAADNGMTLMDSTAFRDVDPKLIDELGYASDDLADTMRDIGVILD